MDSNLMAEEAATAAKLFPKYAGAIIAKPGDETEEGHKRAMLQTVFRLQLLRIEISKLMAGYVGLPENTSVLKTEKTFLGVMALQLAQGQTNSEQILSNLGGMFEVDLSDTIETTSFETTSPKTTTTVATQPAV